MTIQQEKTTNRNTKNNNPTYLYDSFLYHQNEYSHDQAAVLSPVLHGAY